MVEKRKLLAFGDRIREGPYSLHSRFEKVINFTSNNFLVSVVNEKIEKGPTNIVISNLDFNKINSLIIKSEQIILNDITFKITKEKNIFLL